MGSYRPEGWHLVRELFCDSSGFGQDGEAALSFKQLMNTLKEGMGYAVIEEGQFQVHLGEFEKVAFANVRLSA